MTFFDQVSYEIILDKIVFYNNNNKIPVQHVEFWCHVNHMARKCNGSLVKDKK